MQARRKRQEMLKGASLLREEGIDLTPLIDCVFMLLIFFMVTTVFITSKGLNVDLPRASTTTESQPGKDINLIVEEDGVMELNGEVVTMEDLPRELGRLKEELHTENMILQAYPTTLHEVIVKIVDVARAQGIEGIAFARER